MSIKVAIIGKPNTGKSTLFNRIIGFRRAIVLSETGITRDRIHADIQWQGKAFTLVDTGGIDYTQRKESIQKKVLEQTKKAIYESEIILLLLDVMTGIQQEDIDIANIVRKQKKKVILVINKIDLKKSVYFKGDFFQLGLGEPFLISAEQGRNIFELLDMIAGLIPEKKQEPEIIDREDSLIRIAIIGKPNVGKSSILNAILKKERVIVDEIPGTTRDAIEISFCFGIHNLLFVDTSGLKREKGVKDKIEYFSNLRSIEAIKKSDLVLLVLDSTQAISVQDKRLARRIFNEKKACIIILNKYDLISKNKVMSRDYLLQITRYELMFLKDAPILTTIAVNHRSDFLLVLETIMETFNKYSKRISTSELNYFLQKIINQRVPKLIKGRRLRFYYITQTRIKPPSFSIFVNEPKLLYNSYQKFLENQFTQNFNLGGVPIVFDYKKSE